MKWGVKPLTCLLLFGISSGTALFSSALSEKAQSADAFVDSFGVNIHLHYTDTPYGNFPMVKTALANLGVRHVRDGMIDTAWTPYYERLNELGRAGARSTLVTSPSESDALLSSYPQRVHDGFEAYEAPNEYDQSHDPDWAATLRGFCARLYDVVKKNPETAGFSIIGPSLTQPESFPKIAGSERFFDYANLHNYFGGRNPGTAGWGGNGYGSIDWNLNLAREAWPGKPVFTTETGYLGDPSNAQGIPEEISGKYLPRVLLEQWLHGIKRTYLYELIDLDAHDNSFGLVHSDFSPKPGYTALQSLLHLLADPGGRFTPGELAFTLSGDLSDVHHLLLEKRDGSFYLALWVEAPGYDVNAKKVLPVATHHVVVDTRNSNALQLHQIDGEGKVRSSELASTQHPVRLDLDDRVFILQIGP